MTLNNDDFGSLCIYALRYCIGRQTYAPEQVVGIATAGLKELSDKDLGVIISDLDYQRYMDRYGDPKLDKPLWVSFERKVREEQEARRKCQS